MIRHLLAVLLPARDREAVLGDLREEFGHGRASSLRILFALAAIVARRQAEPYRDEGHRRGAAALVALAVGLVWAVHAVGWPGARLPPGYDPVSRLVLEFWAAPHLSSALAAGLVVGRLELQGVAATGPIRRHAAFLLAAMLLVTSPSTATGGLAAALCVAAAEFGVAARP